MSRELGRLQTSVALTFGGNLAKRGGSLDPDTFAVESRRAERERLGLDRRFAGVLAGLSSAVASTIELTAPVFVLPVDDVDLNVRDCVPLLRLLRATSSPHLVVVLAADVALLSTILRLSYQGDLARIGEPVPLSTDDLGWVHFLVTMCQCQRSSAACAEKPPTRCPRGVPISSDVLSTSLPPRRRRRPGRRHPGLLHRWARPAR